MSDELQLIKKIKSYNNYVDDERFDIHDYDDDADHDTDDGGRGSQRPLPGGSEFKS